jgi:hypothetical protein
MTVEQTDIVCFYHHMYSYEISKVVTGILTCIQSCQLYDHQPLSVHSIMLDENHIKVFLSTIHLF